MYSGSHGQFNCARFAGTKKYLLEKKHCFESRQNLNTIAILFKVFRLPLCSLRLHGQFLFQLFCHKADFSLWSFSLVLAFDLISTFWLNCKNWFMKISFRIVTQGGWLGTVEGPSCFCQLESARLWWDGGRSTSKMGAAAANGDSNPSQRPFSFILLNSPFLQ